MRLGLRGKWVLTTSVLLVAFSATATAIDTRTQREMFRYRLVEKASALSSILAATAADPLAMLDVARLRLFLADVLEQEEVIYAYVFDDEGRVVTDGTAENRHRDERLEDPVSVKAVSAESTRIQFGPDTLDVAEPIYLGWKKIGGVRLGFSLKRIQEEITSAYHRKLALGITFGVLGSVVAFLLARSITRPIEQLTEGVIAVARGQFDRRVEIGTSDEVAVLASYFNRMTEQVQRAEEALSQQAVQLAKSNAKLKEKNAELESFVYTVSHDLKAPLVTLQGMAELLMEEYRMQLGEQGHHYLNRLRMNARQMERLIFDLLTVSRIGREGRPAVAVPLGEVMEDVLLEWGEAIKTRGITLTSHDLPTLWGVRTQIEQVMSNLVGNAIKYLGEPSEPLIEIGAKDDGGPMVECYVRDNGIGINPAYHEKVFEIFQRLKDTEVEGTGVGLAIVKKIVDGAGGRIWVESAKGQGSTFSFTWPKATGEGAP